MIASDLCVCVFMCLCVDMSMTLFVFTTCLFFIICHVHAMRRRYACPLIGAAATSTNVAFFATDETATLHESYTEKTNDFRSPTMFFRVVETKKL